MTWLESQAPRMLRDELAGWHRETWFAGSGSLKYPRHDSAPTITIPWIAGAIGWGSGLAGTVEALDAVHPAALADVAERAKNHGDSTAALRRGDTATAAIALGIGIRNRSVSNEDASALLQDHGMTVAEASAAALAIVRDTAHR